MALHPEFRSIDLCAGADGLGLGLSLAVELLGGTLRSVCMVEREAYAAATLVGQMEAQLLAPAPVWSDLATFDARPFRGRVHFVTSGDPCQPNSVAGKRGGAKDDRFLIDQVLRVVEECGPIGFLRENVPGNADGQLSALVPPLEAMGYRVECGIFSSAETGNSHGRRRLFLLAWRSDREGWLYPRSWRSVEGAADTPRAGGKLGTMAHTNGRYATDQSLAIGGSDRAADAGSGSREMADASGPRLERHQLGRSCHDEWHRQDAPRSAPELRGAYLPAAPVLIPGPSDSRWGELLALHPELAPAIDEEEAQRLFRRGFDALASRVDRLRLLGNGVDPVAAAYAFLCLHARHVERAHANAAPVRAVA